MGGFFIWILKIYTWICLKLYFSKFQINGLENIPEKGPLLFAVNHQNAFLDAILIACSSTRFPYFLARADVFNSSLAQFFLKWLHIMPIYRFRDGLGEVRKSIVIINKCIELLEKGEAVLIFPEGNHDLKLSLRQPLQKGIARIAFGSQELIEDLKIVPVGLQYENHSKYDSRVLVSYGQSFPVRQFIKEGNDHSKKDMERLLQTLYEKMQALMVHIPGDNYEEILGDWINRRVICSDLVSQLDSDQKIIKKIIEKKGDSATAVNEKISMRKVLYITTRGLLLIIFFLPYIIIKFILKYTIEDPVFIGPMQFSWGIIFYPFFYLLTLILIYQISGNWIYAVSYLLGVPLLIILSKFFKVASLQ